MNSKLFLLSLLFLCVGISNVDAKPKESKGKKGKTTLVTAYAATTPVKPDFVSHTYKSFIDFYGNGINEKVYLQTDKPYYSAGEDLWFKGYIVNSITHIPATKSAFIYVELRDGADSLIQRVQIKSDNFGFHNKLSLSNKLAPGEYSLWGYTQWMRNWEDDFYFHKKFEIVNPIDDNITIYPSYKKDGDDKMKVTFTFGTSTQNVVAKCGIYLTTGLENGTRTSYIRTNDKGEVSVSLDLDSKATYFKLKSDSDTYLFDKLIYIPQLEDKLDVQFFPEGGALLAGVPQAVAFKAIGVDGNGREIEGAIFNSKDEQISSISSSFMGMGRFTLFAGSGDSYYAKVYLKDDPKKIETRYDLPSVVQTGCAVAVVQSPGQIIYQIRATPDVNPAKLGVVIHAKGKVVNCYPVQSIAGAKKLYTDQLPEGIVTISVVNKEDYTPIAERLVFVPYKGNKSVVAIDKKPYADRQLVDVLLNLKDSKGKPVAGEFAMAVTDRTSVDLSLENDNIVSNLLVTSDLKGYIEKPAAYFSADAKSNSLNLDLLMLTQGWRRYSLGQVLTNSVAIPTFEAEENFKISGEIRGFFGNAARNPSLVLYNPRANFMDKFQLGDAHKFNLYDIDYPDSTEITLQAISRGGSARNLFLKVNEFTYPNIAFRYPAPVVGKQKVVVPEDFILQMRDKFYADGGMQFLEFDAIQVTADRKEDGVSELFDVIPSESMVGAELDALAGMSLMQGLAMFSGVTVSADNEISVKSAGQNPLIFVNQALTELDFVLDLQMSDIEAIGIVTGADAYVYGPGSESGVILIQLKDGASLSDAIPTLGSVAFVRRLGYKKPETFYQPKYNDPKVLADRSKPDLRTTIAWNPKIVTDSTGVAKLQFYTADREGTYDIVVEGISEKGDIIRATATATRKD